jgi:hypothetical protein
MKTATIKKIHFGAYIKWSLVAYAIFAVFTGLFQSLSAYASARENLGGYLLWYGAEIFFLYFAIGICSGSIFVFVYNSFVGSFGGYRFEIEISESLDSVPPPPPVDIN